MENILERVFRKFIINTNKETKQKFFNLLYILSACDIYDGVEGLVQNQVFFSLFLFAFDYTITFILF